MVIPKVTGYTGVIPDRRTQSAEDFTSAAVTWTDYQATTLVPSTNAAINGINAAQGEILASVNNAEESSFIAQAAANYQGPWFSGASVVKGESWSHNGLMWAANVTGAGEPQESAQWFLLKSEPELSAIKVMLEQWGYRYVGLFDDGFTYSQVGDAGVDNNNDAWIYVGAGTPNKAVSAGTVPNIVAGYERVEFNSAGGIVNAEGESVQKVTTQSRQAIESAYKAQGYNNVFFFEDGFIYAESNDVGVYKDGTAWTYANLSELPVTITAGTIPSVGSGYEQVAFNSASKVSNANGGSVQGFIDSQNLNAIVLNADGHLSKVKVTLSGQGEIYNVFNDLDKVATIYDKNGGNIAQDGVSNVSDSEGGVIFYVPSGSYKLSSETGEIRFSAGGSKTLRESSCTASSVAAITNTHYSRLDVASKSILNYVIIDIKTKGSSSKLLEVGIYDDSFNLITSSEVREIISAGKNYIALPHVSLGRGEYFIGVTTNSLDAEFLINDHAGGYTSSSAMPLESNPDAVISPQCLQATAVLNSYPVINGELEVETGRKWRVYGIDETNRQPWGLNTQTFYICKSVDSGATFIDVMYTPPLGNGIADLIVSGGKIYILMNDMNLYESSDMTESATWTNITCPVNDDLRSPNAVARPYGLEVWSGYVYLGEYTAGNGVTGEVRTTGQSMGPDPVRGPRILKFNLSTREWSISREFKKARHIHSFLNAGSAVLWVSVGDALWGDEIGIHRLTESGLDAGSSDGDDSWTQWTSSTPPNTSHYPVDFTVISDGNKTYDGETAINGIYQTSDRPGKHVLYTGLAGEIGKFNVSAQNFATNGISTETVRSIVADTDNRNLWYFSAETTDPAIYVSPPPYAQSIRVKGFKNGELNNLFRSVYSNGYIMMFNVRFKVSKFVGQ